MEENQPNNYEAKRQERLKEQNLLQRKRTIRRFIKTILIIAIVAIPIVGLVWYGATRPKTPESDIISQKGIHWHPELVILIKGQKQGIPANIGIGVVHKPMHTHDDMGVIHLEFSGLVKKEDVRLGNFFEIWNKKFNKDCIFDKCSGLEGKLKMFVNGQENFDFENYIMRNGDKIEIVFE